MTGSVASGTPSGALETMACGTVYVATPGDGESAARRAPPPPPETAVVIATDVFGLSPNAKLLADSFARRGGFLTVVPDMFGATALPVWIMDAVGALMKKMKKKDDGKKETTTWAASLMSAVGSVLQLVFLALPRILVFFWYNGDAQKKLPLFDALGRVHQSSLSHLKSHLDRMSSNFNRFTNSVWTKLPKGGKLKCTKLMSPLQMAELREKRGIKRICIIGYCYGAPISIRYGRGDLPTPAVSAFATAHGKIRVPDDIEPLVRPGLFLCADNDFAFPDKERLQAEAMLRTKMNKSNIDIDYYKFKHYPGASHGFAVRADEADEVAQRAFEDAFEQAVAFFQDHTK